ncbi:MAG TPA: cytochrome P450 [Pseudonocardiaceae bacterium]|nr:cytochrome P450 [Pseudonocardiaceae bacterium]
MASTSRIQQVSDTQGRPAWLVSGHQMVRDLLADPRLSRSHPNPGHPVRLTLPGLFGGPIPDPDGELVDLTRMRKLLTPPLSARRMEALRPRIHAIVDQALDDLEEAGAPADFHALVAFPLPALVVCELLGVPGGDRADFLRWQIEAKEVARPAVARGGLQSLWRYLGTLIERKRWVPGEDVITELLRAAGTDPALTDDGIAHLAAGMLFAGHAPVVAIIDRGMLLLLTHHDQREALRADPALAPSAVEEIFRFASPLERQRATRRGGLTRYASVDVDVEAEGVTIRAGDTVMFAVQEANEDAGVFPEPMRFDISRERVPHLSLSHGGHFCLGAHAARATLQYLFVRLFSRFPALRLAVPLAEIRPVREAVAGAVSQLPVTW